MVTDIRLLGYSSIEWAYLA